MKKIVCIAAFICSFNIAFANPQDSIGVKKENGKTFLLHKVTKGETLYGLNRKYKVTVDDLKSNNPGIEKSLKIGDVIKIPRNYAVADVVKTTAVYTKTTTVKTTTTTKATKHTVLKGETLSGISRKYNVSVEEICAWNNIKGVSINIGQVLTINPKSTVQVATTTDTPKGNAGTVEVDPNNVNTVEPVKPIKVDGMPVNTQGEELQTNRFEPQYEGVEINESGKLSIVNDNPSLDPNRNFVLHHSARIGTILMVTNPSNNQSVFARVVGNFKQEGDKKGIVVVMNSTMSERLALAGSTPNIKINYAK